MTARRAIHLAAGILLALVFLQSFFAMRQFSAAVDEVTHLPAGYSYWKTGRITLNPQHPPFLKLAAALPVLWLHPQFDPNDPSLSGPDANEWEFGRKFLFHNDADRILFAGRLAPILITVLLGFYVFRWASELFDPRAGLLALALFAFTPTILGHSHFVTTDVPVTAFAFITLYYFWKMLRNDGKGFVAAGVFLGIALGTKFSAVFLLPMMAVFWAGDLWRRKDLPAAGTDRRKSKGAGARSLSWLRCLGVFAIAAAVLWAIYLFPFDPLFYKKGLDSLYADKDPSHLYYLNGEFKVGGWWYYFVEAFVLKTPVPSLILFAAALVMIRKYPIQPLDKLFLLLPVVVFTAATSFSAHDIGVRYMIPVYPFLIVLAAGLLAVKWSIQAGRLVTVIAVGLVFWQALASMWIYPDYLGYFNELAGGPAGGPKYLDDSNVDWGQDLKRLAEYQRKYPDLKVAYPWQNIDLAYYGVTNNLMDASGKWWSKPSGRYALSAHFLVRTKQVSQMLNDPELDWQALYRPVDRIGYSFYVYEFK